MGYIYLQIFILPSKINGIVQFCQIYCLKILRLPQTFENLYVFVIHLCIFLGLTMAGCINNAYACVIKAV